MPTGSSRFRRYNKDGTASYQLRVMIRGRTWTKTVRVKGKREADDALRSFLMVCEEEAAEEARREASPLSWPELCAAWLEEYARPQHKASTFSSEKDKIRARVAPAFHSEKADEISRREVQAWVNSLAEEVSPKTVRNLYGIARQVFTWAEDMGLIEESPCERIKLPAMHRKEARHLDLEELGALLQAIEGEPLKWRAAVFLAVFGGLRKGEVLGLRWSALDLETGRTEIRANRQTQPGGGSYVDSPKTEAGVREVVLPGVVLTILRELREKTPDAEFVISHDDGQAVSPSALADWVFRFRARHPEAPVFSMHALRHTHASLLRYVGLDLEQIQHRLGHADKATTSLIYVHLFEDIQAVDREAADRIDALFRSL